MKRVLILNNSEEVLTVVTWQRAVQLMFSGKAEKPHGHDKVHYIQTSNSVFPLPTVLILDKYVPVPHKLANLSKKNIMRRDGGRCGYCETKLEGTNETIDHVIPRARGGKHDWKNVVACCKRCNSRKGCKTAQEANMTLHRKLYVPTKRMLVYSAAVLGENVCESWSRWLEK